MRLHGNIGASVPSWQPGANAHTRGKCGAAVERGAGAAEWCLPLDAAPARIYHAADDAARAVYRVCDTLMNATAIRLGIDALCDDYGIPHPAGKTEGEAIRRGLDKGWWLRHLRKHHLRRCEHNAIATGKVGKGIDPYISRESALKQMKRNADNRRLLESITLENETGYKATLAELADKGTANKAIRRGELMTRIRGFEELADLLNHCAMFWTITAPSKYHSVGGTNSKYNGATPRDAQRYLCKNWSRIRAQFNREGIRPYGFRIAEPHTDGCPHWHMLFFVERKDAARMNEIIMEHALAEDGDEAGAKENRVKLVQIDTSNGGSAAGYIAKYVSKNIDGHGVGDHKAFENGETYTVQTDLLGHQVITASQRVTYWAQVWGIRQFQQIGGAPVGIWRELRRITAETIEGAPDEMQRAWKAAQAVKSENEEEARQADYAEYTLALGGIGTGRNTSIALYRDVVTIEGKYATYEAKKPVGVYAVSERDVIYKSVRYTWTEVSGKSAEISGAFAVPRTGVNNCTQPGDNAPWTNPKIKPRKYGEPSILFGDFIAEWKLRRDGEYVCEY